MKLLLFKIISGLISREWNIILRERNRISLEWNRIFRGNEALFCSNEKDFEGTKFIYKERYFKYM